LGYSSNNINSPTAAPVGTFTESSVSGPSKLSQQMTNIPLNKPSVTPINKPKESDSISSATLNRPNANFQTIEPTIISIMTNPSTTSAPSPVLLSINSGESSNNQDDSSIPTRTASVTIVGAAIGAVAVLMISCSICYHCTKSGGSCVPVIAGSRFSSADREAMVDDGYDTMALPYGSSENTASEDEALEDSVHKTTY
jgi:hypothetical protein